MRDRLGITLGGLQLRQLRARIVHQARYAAQIGIHPVTLNRVLSGTVQPSLGLLRKICDGVGLEPHARIVIEIRPKEGADSKAMRRAQERMQGSGEAGDDARDEG